MDNRPGPSFSSTAENVDPRHFESLEDSAVAGATKGQSPGMHVLEAVAWTWSMFAIHAVTGLTALFLLAGMVIAPDIDAATLEDSEQSGEIFQAGIETAQSLFTTHVMTFEMGLFVVFAIAVAALRIGTPLHRKLNLLPIGPLHLLCMFAMLLPLTIVTGGFYSVADMAWQHLTADMKIMRVLDSFNTVNAMKSITASISFPMLLLLVAVAPAVGEELIFRGVIGRGLTARYGLVLGIFFSSVLFAMVHGHPVHAIGVFPLGVCMHIAYVATRSFWAPVLIHFLNNAMAVVFSKMLTEEMQQAAEQTAQSPSVSPILFAFAALAVCAILTLIWKTRVQYFYKDGSAWDPGFPTVEQPPATVNAHAGRYSVSNWMLVGAASAMIAFFVAGSYFGPEDNQQQNQIEPGCVIN